MSIKIFNQTYFILINEYNRVCSLLSIFKVEVTSLENIVEFYLNILNEVLKYNEANVHSGLINWHFVYICTSGLT